MRNRTSFRCLDRKAWGGVPLRHLVNASPETVEREFGALRNIPDNYPKMVLSLDKFFGDDLEGIKRYNLIDFLMDGGSKLKHDVSPAG